MRFATFEMQRLCGKGVPVRWAKSQIASPILAPAGFPGWAPPHYDLEPPEFSACNWSYTSKEAKVGSGVSVAPWGYSSRHVPEKTRYTFLGPLGFPPVLRKDSIRVLYWALIVEHGHCTCCWLNSLQFEMAKVQAGRNRKGFILLERKWMLA